jgi:sarcosine oxidase subunit beta
MEFYYDVVIIGAGSVGLPLSFYLAEKGLKVGVVEKMPSVGRGQNRAAIGGIRATHSDPAKIKICQMTIEIMRNFEAIWGMDIDWIAGGYLFPVYDESTQSALQKLLEYQKHFNLNIDWIGPEKINKLVPGINSENLLGGTFSPEDGSASPLKVADAYYQLSRKRGVDFHFNEIVIDFQLQNNAIQKIITDRNIYYPGLVVDASGAGSRELGQKLNLDIPVYPESHEAGISEPVRRFFEPMIVDIRPEPGSANYYFYQNKEGQVVFCITPEPKIPGQDIDSTSVFLPQIVRRMVQIYPRLRNLRVRRTWRGLYPMTPDGFPIACFTQKINNLLLTVGMCGQGFMLGPGLGQILAEIIADEKQDYNDILRQLTLYRSFSGEELLK